MMHGRLLEQGGLPHMLKGDAGALEGLDQQAALRTQAEKHGKIGKGVWRRGRESSEK